MSEKKVEAYLKKRVEELGGLCLKFVSPSRRGVPDRICISASGFTYYVELKFGNNSLSPTQKLFKLELEKRGVDLHVLNSKQQVDTFIQEIYY